jgi:hypothetical protein
VYLRAKSVIGFAATSLVNGLNNGIGTPFLRAGCSNSATMKSKKQNERYEFTPDELKRMKEYLERKTVQKEVVGLLDRYSGDFADWTNTICEAVNELIARKLQKNEDCEKERKMLDGVSALFSKLADYGAMLANWNAQLTVGIKHTETMIEEGHP